MVTDLADNPPLPWRYINANRDINALVNAPGWRQLAVAIGGAVQHIPQQTAPVRL